GLEDPDPALAHDRQHNYMMPQGLGRGTLATLPTLDQARPLPAKMAWRTWLRFHLAGGSFRRLLVRAAFVLALPPAAAWMFIAGLNALPPLGTVSNVLLHALYAIIWGLSCLAVVRAYQRAAHERLRCTTAETSAAQ